MKITKVNISKRRKIESYIRLYGGNNEIYFIGSGGYWCKMAYDNNDNEIYSENCSGYLYKCEFDENNNLIYQESSIFGIEINKIKNNLEIKK